MKDVRNHFRIYVYVPVNTWKGRDSVIRVIDTLEREVSGMVAGTRWTRRAVEIMVSS